MALWRSKLGSLLIIGTLYLGVTQGLFKEELNPGPKTGVPVKLPLNKIFDGICADIRQFVTQKELEPINLPTDSDNFTATLFGDQMDGYVWVGDGSVEGIATLHRTGDIRADFKPVNRKVVFKAHAGLTDLKAKYSTQFKLGPFHSNFKITVKISSIRLGVTGDFTIPLSNATLDECTIDDLSTLQVQLKGIGLFDSKLYSTLVNAISQLLQPVIAKKVESVVCGLLLDAFGGQ